MIADFTRGLGPVCLLPLLLSCTGTETGNPSFEGTVAFNAWTSEPQRAALGETDAELTVTNVFLSLGDVEFLREGACDSVTAESGVTRPGLGTGDHGTKAVAELDVTIPGADYCGLRLQLVPSTTAPESAPDVQGRSLLLRVQLDAGTVVTVSTRQAITLRVAARDGVLLSPEQPRVLVAFDVAAWLDNLSVSQLSQLMDDPRISEEEHPELLLLVLDQLARGVSAFRDDDGSGQVEDSETPLSITTSKDP